MADGAWGRRTWTWLEPWLKHLVWMDLDATGAYLAWRHTQGALRSRHLEVLKVA